MSSASSVGADPASRSHPRDSVVDGVVRAPAACLAALVLASAVVRAAVGLRVPSPWILPDEIVYSELAKSIAEGNRPSIRGIPVFGWGEVYPTLIAPAWVVFDDAVTAYHAALAINALVMSLAAVPAYFLARMFVSERASLVVALMSVLVPSMTYTGVVMTENAFYPAFLVTVLLIARAVREPTLGAQAWALLGLGLVALTRIQGLALVGSYLAAVLLYALTGRRGERGSYLRRFLPTAVLVPAAVLAPLVVSTARGEGPFEWLGARSGTFDVLRLSEVPEWFVFLVADLVLYVAVVPAAATAVLLGTGLRAGAEARVRLFACVALPTVAALVASVSLVSAALDVDGTENLNERYVFYVVPLLFVGFALWIRQGLPRPRPWAGLGVAALCLLAIVLPIDRLAYNAGFQSPALLPWLELSRPRGVLLLAVGAFVAALGVLWLRLGETGARRLWSVVAAWMTLVALMAVDTGIEAAALFARTFEPGKEAWIDRAVPRGADVVVVWREEAPAGTPDPFYFSVMVNEMFNAGVGDVYAVGGPTHYESFLPTRPAAAGPDGTLRDEAGTPVGADFVLTSCRTPIEGRIVARSPTVPLQLVRPTRPVRLVSGAGCPDAGRS